MALQECSCENSDFRKAAFNASFFDDCQAASMLLRGAKMYKLGLMNTTMPRYDFSDMDMEYVQFTGSVLDGANFSRCRLNGVNFFQCQLHQANFQEAQARQCLFNEARMTDAQLAQGSFAECLFITTALTGAARYTRNSHATMYTSAAL